MSPAATLNRLDKVYNEALRIKITDEDKFVIFSDLHLGNGGFNDDFTKNSALFTTVLKDYYLKRNYNLILNGDVEELYKFSIRKIYNKWAQIYEIFDDFKTKNKLFKIFGNHDFELVLKHAHTHNYEIHQALRLEYKENTIFIYHGHQTANYLEQYSLLVLYLVRYIFRMFANDSVPIENETKYSTENKAYDYSINKKIVSILGHTHRPLFESLSRIEYLKMSIENLLIKYKKATEREKNQIEIQLKKYKEELKNLYFKDKIYNQRNSIYDEQVLLPCLFNSGAVSGKRGVTGIEIKNGKIFLVYWFDKNKSKRYLNYDKVVSKRLDETDYYKAILKKESLNTVFTRIKLLS